MTTTNIETQEKAQPGSATGPKPPRKAPVAKPARHVASAKAKSGKKTTAAKQTAKAAKAVKPAKKESGARQGSKTEKVLGLLKRADGATLKELMKATGWQPHSVRGFLSKGEEGERNYSVKA